MMQSIKRTAISLKMLQAARVCDAALKVARVVGDVSHTSWGVQFSPTSCQSINQRCLNEQGPEHSVASLVL